MSKRILLVGSGAREHALARALARADTELFVAPGNPGTALAGTNVPINADDVQGLVVFARRERVDLVVVGPELPLTLGLVDAMAVAGVPTFGPTRAAAALEGSKVFMKRLLARAGVPTADFEVFEAPDRAEDYVRHARRPLVVKADGLAAGKGVTVASTPDEALAAIDRIMRGRQFGDAGRAIVVEELLPGEEASFHVVCDGGRAVVLAAAQDHKRVFDGDNGPNTGGMGAYAPAPLVTPELERRVMKTIIEPLLETMENEGTPFRGVLFAGLMIDEGVPRVLEFNVRFGDPETAVLVPTFPGDWLELLEGAALGRLPERIPRPSGAALCVVMAAAGYPDRPTVGDVIEGADAVTPEGVFVLHAGTRRREDGVLVTNGGRVLTVGAHGATVDVAARAAYAAVGGIRFRGEHHRTDIGARAR